MSPQDLPNELRRRPFEPFRIHVSDGTKYDIHHPELVLPGLTAAIVGIPTDPEHPDVYGRTQTVALNHIVRLEPLSQQSPTGDGQP